MPAPHVRSAFVALALLLSPLLTGCDSTTSGEMLAGRYVASQFTLTVGGESIDVLDAGGSVEMTLRVDGTVSGHMTVPAELAEGDTDFDLTGTYAVTSEGLEFDQSADTFIRDVAWGFDAAGIRAGTPQLSIELSKE